MKKIIELIKSLFAKPAEAAAVIEQLDVEVKKEVEVIKEKINKKKAAKKKKKNESK